MVLLVLASFAAGGGTEQCLRRIIRGTAQVGAPLFAAAFAARPLQQLRVSGVSRWLLRNRRALGLSFAVAHFTHLGALVALGWGCCPEPFRSDLDPLTLVGGGIAYFLLAAMTVTSFDRPAAWLGARRWKQLHRLGGYVLGLVLLLNYLGLVIGEGRGAFQAASLVAAFALRVGAWALPARRAQGVSGESQPPAVGG
jgi:DMSO/TMAO reductase YedYZ heme-binding membrane subunit